MTLKSMKFIHLLKKKKLSKKQSYQQQKKLSEATMSHVNQSQYIIVTNYN